MIPFERALEAFRPLLQAHGFQLDQVERPASEADNGFAEYLSPGLKLRLVWEGHERALWVESARLEGTMVISRWQDVEWSVAGRRLPLDRDLSDARVERLRAALEQFLAQVRRTRQA